jgi:hypothetical protein
MVKVVHPPEINLLQTMRSVSVLLVPVPAAGKP